MLSLKSALCCPLGLGCFRSKRSGECLGLVYLSHVEAADGADDGQLLKLLLVAFVVVAISEFDLHFLSAQTTLD